MDSRYLYRQDGHFEIPKKITNVALTTVLAAMPLRSLDLLPSFVPEVPTIIVAGLGVSAVRLGLGISGHILDNRGNL